MGGFRHLSCITLMGAVLTSCAISTPLGPIFGSPSEQDATGSISNPAVPAALQAGGADRQRLQAALQQAFATAGPGSQAHWTTTLDNRSGSVAAVAGAFTENARQCRMFVATLASPGEANPAGAEWFQGKACLSPDSGWSIQTLDTWSEPFTPAAQQGR